MRQFVMLSDPRGVYLAGEIVSDAVARLAMERGASALPCDPRGFGVHACAGYFRRDLGKGVDLNPHARVAIAPLALYALRDLRCVGWALRLEPVGVEPAGNVRLMSQSSPVMNAGGIAASSSVDLGSLGKPDEAGGWTVYGTAALNLSGDGFVSLSIYGFGRGLRAMWAAVSQCGE